MVADDVEAIRVAHARERMQEFGLRQAEVVAAGPAGNVETRLASVPESPEANSVTSWSLAHEAVHEQADDRLGAAVAPGRHGEPGWREHCDSQTLRTDLAADELLRPLARALRRAHRSAGRSLAPAA